MVYANLVLGWVATIELRSMATIYPGKSNLTKKKRSCAENSP